MHAILMRALLMEKSHPMESIQMSFDEEFDEANLQYRSLKAGCSILTSRMLAISTSLSVGIQ